jgi:hypothetical protein
MRDSAPLIQFLASLLFLPGLSGCAVLASSATTSLAEDVSAAVLDQEDPALVRDGGPSYLIALDGLIEGDPENETLLLAGARLYTAYSSGFVEDPERVKLMTRRARDYGDRAICLRSQTICDAIDGSFEAFDRAILQTTAKDVDALYGFGSAWAGWVQAHSADWAAIADLPKVQAVMERVVALDDHYQEGGPHVFLGILYTLRPAAMGGKPELGRQHFERAIELSDGRNLTAKTLLARLYARLVFDRDLHDRLLTEVIEADPRARGFTLSNTLAQREARELLADADDYF